MKMKQHKDNCIVRYKTKDAQQGHGQRKCVLAPTPAQYGAFQEAYDFFNAELFAGALPQVLVTMQRHPSYGGYFSPKRFRGRKRAVTVHELALNPDGFHESTDEWICSILVHEMAHAWQQEYGKPSRSGYHNREWAARMKAIGLQPSDTGNPGGKETGQRVSHYVIPNGSYAVAYKKLHAGGFQLQWHSIRRDVRTQKQKRDSKTTFTCPNCGQNGWGKPDARFICGKCSLQIMMVSHAHSI